MIYLREISKEDLTTINQWRKNKTLIDNLGDTFRYTNIETDQRWFENYLQNKDRNIRLAICLESNDEHIGNVYLLNINTLTRSAEFQIFIGDTKFYGKGIGLLATKQCLSHGFKDHNLHRIELLVLEHNNAALSLYEKAGFKQEGIARDAVFKNGKYWNMVQMSILKPEFVE